MIYKFWLQHDFFEDFLKINSFTINSIFLIVYIFQLQHDFFKDFFKMFFHLNRLLVDIIPKIFYRTPRSSISVKTSQSILSFKVTENNPYVVIDVFLF